MSNRGTKPNFWDFRKSAKLKFRGRCITPSYKLPFLAIFLNTETKRGGRAQDLDIEALIEIAIEQELAESVAFDANQDVTEKEIARLEAEAQADQSTTLILF